MHLINQHRPVVNGGEDGSVVDKSTHWRHPVQGILPWRTHSARFALRIRVKSTGRLSPRLSWQGG